MNQPYSEAELSGFLDYTVQKGLLNQSTARSRKIAAQRVLSALDDHEKIDLRTLDLDDTFQRFVNKNAKDFTPESLAAYKSRFKSAIEDFLRYVENPTGFRPGTSTRTVRRSEGQDEAAGRSSVKRAGRQEAVKREEKIAPPTSGTIVFPVPIRPGVIVQLHGLPTDMTPEEAERIAAVVQALAVKK